MIPFTSTFATLWSREDPDEGCMGQQRLRLLGPTGAELGTFQGKIDLVETARARTMVQFNVIQLEAPGRHEWEVSSRIGEDQEWTVATRVPFDLEVRDPGEEEVASSDVGGSSS